MNIPRSLRDFSLLAALAYCDAHAHTITFHENRIFGTWEETVTTRTAPVEGMGTPPPQTTRYTGNFDVSQSTPQVADIKTQPHGAGFAYATASANHLFINAHAVGYSWWVNPLSTVDFNRINMTLQSTTRLRADEQNLSFNLSGLLSFNYFNDEQYFRFALRDVTTGAVLSDFFVPQDRTRPFSYEMLFPTVLNHEYEFFMESWFTSFSSKDVRLTANLAIADVPDAGNPLALLSAGIISLALFARRRARA